MRSLHFELVAATSDLGLGEGEWLFRDGPMAGYGKVVPRLVRNGMKRLLPLNASDGRLWTIGATDGIPMAGTMCTWWWCHPLR